MPSYSFYCPNCGHFDNICTISQRNDACECPNCKQMCGRDVEHELQNCGNFDETCKNHVRLSNSMGVLPKRIKEMEKKYPGSKYTPDGRLIVNSRKDKLLKMKQRGLVEYE